MKDKELKIKVDDQFIEKVDYIQRINDFKNRSDCVRKVVEKEYRKEQFPCGCCKCYEDKKCILLDAEVNPRTRDERCPLEKDKEDCRVTVTTAEAIKGCDEIGRMIERAYRRKKEDD